MYHLWAIIGRLASDEDFHESCHGQAILDRIEIDDDNRILDLEYNIGDIKHFYEHMRTVLPLSRLEFLRLFHLVLVQKISLQKKIIERTENDLVLPKMQEMFPDTRLGFPGNTTLAAIVGLGCVDGLFVRELRSRCETADDTTLSSFLHGDNPNLAPPFRPSSDDLTRTREVLQTTMGADSIFDQMRRFDEQRWLQKGTNLDLPCDAGYTRRSARILTLPLNVI